MTDTPARRAAEKIFVQMNEVAAGKRDEISMREWGDIIAAEYADFSEQLEQLAWTLRDLFKSFPQPIAEALQTAISEPIISEGGIGDAEAAVGLATKHLEELSEANAKLRIALADAIRRP